MRKLWNFEMVKTGQNLHANIEGFRKAGHIYFKLQVRKFFWFPGYMVEIKYKLLYLKFILSFFMIILQKPWFPGYKVEI